MNAQLPTLDTFEEFVSGLEAEGDLIPRIDELPILSGQLKDAFWQLYCRAQTDVEFRRVLVDNPTETVLEFVKNAISEAELTEDELEAVAGGEVTRDSSLGYDIGYAVGSLVEWVVDKFD